MKVTPRPAMQQWEILLDLDDVTEMLEQARTHEVFVLPRSSLQVTHVDRAPGGDSLIRICVTEVADG